MTTAVKSVHNFKFIAEKNLKFKSFADGKSC